MISKVNISEIISAHLTTLSSPQNDRVLVTDIILFYGIPALAAAGAYYFLELPTESHIEAIISVYAIFSALLISAQVALYSIFRSWNIQGSDSSRTQTKNAALRETTDKNRIKLAKQVNANLSYLISWSVFALILCVLFLIFGSDRSLEDAVILGMAAHFTLTLFMIVKRMHVLFDAEYC